VSIRDIWNAVEAVVVKQGFVLADVDDVSQGKRYTIRVLEIPGDQQLRGSIGSGMVRLVFAIEVSLVYVAANDKRIERKVAEDAETIIAAIYGNVNLSNHHYTGSVVERNAATGVVTNRLRFDFQSQATL
jgi:hypothetical protein